MVAPKAIGSRQIVWAMMMNVVISHVAVEDQGRWNTGKHADVNVGQPIQSFTLPNSQMDVIVLDHMHADDQNQLQQKQWPRESVAPLRPKHSWKSSEIQKRLKVVPASHGEISWPVWKQSRRDADAKL